MQRWLTLICVLFCSLVVPALAQDFSTSADSVRAWEDRLLARDAKDRAAAEVALAAGAERSIPVIRQLLSREDDLLRSATFEVIRRIGPPAIPMLADLLQDKQVEVRRLAIDTLIDLAPYTEGSQAALRRALKDKDDVVAGDAARALGALGSLASPSVSALVKTLAHEDPYTRVYAAEALAAIGPKAAAATRDLAGALTDSVPGVRWAACEALGSIGPAAQSAVPQLIEALKDDYLYVRTFAAGALGSIGPKAQKAVEAL